MGPIPPEGRYGSLGEQRFGKALDCVRHNSDAQKTLVAAREGGGAGDGWLSSTAFIHKESDYLGFCV